MEEVFGKLTLPTESTIVLSTDKFNLTGTDGIWAHSLALTTRGHSTCATIDVSISVLIFVQNQKSLIIRISF